MAQTKGRKTTGSKTSGSGTSRKKSTSYSNRNTGKTGTANRTRRKSGSGRRNQEENRVSLEIRLVLVLLLCILIFISCIGLAGRAGEVIGDFFYGLLGTMALVFPFLLLYLFVFISVNGNTRKVASRTASVIGLYLSLCTFIQLLYYGYQRDVSVSDLYRASATGHAGGGLVGGLFTQFFGYIFGTIGAYIIVIACMVIFSVLLFQKAILDFVQKKGSAAYETRNDRIIAREEKRRERLQRRDSARAQREREQMIREKQRIRTERAREQSAAARRVDPQTITPADGNERIRQYPTKDISPITAASTEIPADDKRMNTGDKVSTISGFRAEDIPDDIIDNGGTDSRQRRAAVTVSGKSGRGHTAGENADAAGIRTEAGDADHDGANRGDIHRSSAASATGAAADTAAAAGTAATAAKAATASAATAASGVSRQHTGTGTAGRDSAVEKITVEEQAEKPFTPPPVDLLDRPSGDQSGESNAHLKQMGAKLQQTLQTFGVEVKINHISCGPSVTRFELTPKMGVKVSKIMGLHDDIKLALAAEDIRIEAPIPGKSAVGIEVPNKKKMTVNFRELIETEEFRSHKSPLAFAVGRNIAGQAVVADLAKMPHLLIAGATGSGKSVFINTLIMSLIYKSTPDEVKFIMIDPKVVELSVYNGIPEMLIPVVTDPKKAAGALNWAVSEMTDRYRRFAEAGARDLKSYNARISHMEVPEGQKRPRKMYRIVIIVDELADLMMAAQNEVEESICRLAQLARAAGIHLVIATQRPSVDVITGLIKANMPSRVALSVTSGVDSRTILDMNGAEKLLGNGDMLFYPQGYQKPARIQGAFLSDDEISRVTDFLKNQNDTSGQASQAIQEEINSHITSSAGSGGDSAEQDEYFVDAGRLIIEKDKASIGMLQRAFRIGFNRAARIMDQLCDAGVVGEEEGTKPRKILMSMEKFENYLEGSE